MSDRLSRKRSSSSTIRMEICGVMPHAPGKGKVRRAVSWFPSIFLARRNWQPDRKRHAFSGRAFHEDLALMLSDDIVTDGQPQAGAVSLRGKEWIENKGHGLFGDKRARVMEIHAHAPTIIAGV